MRARGASGCAYPANKTRQAPNRHENVLGPDHPCTKHSASIAAAALAALGRADEAAALRARRPLGGGSAA
jgi:hypothetical protein